RVAIGENVHVSSIRREDGRSPYRRISLWTDPRFLTRLDVDTPHGASRVLGRSIDDEQFAIVGRPIGNAPVPLGFGDEPRARSIRGIHDPQIAIGPAVAATPCGLECNE